MADKSQVTRLLDQVVADAPNLQGVVVGFVRHDGTAGVRYTTMSTATLSHLARILDLKIDREYTSSLFSQSPVMRAPSLNQAPAPAPKKRSKRGKNRDA